MESENGSEVLMQAVRQPKASRLKPRPPERQYCNVRHGRSERFDTFGYEKWEDPFKTIGVEERILRGDDARLVRHQVVGKSAGTVTLNLYGSYSWMIPAIESLKLGIPRMGLLKRSCEFHSYLQQPFAPSTNDEYLVFRTALASEVIPFLIDKKYDVSVYDHRDWSGPLGTSPSIREGLIEEQPEFIKALEQHAFGRIEVVSFKHKVSNMATICRLYAQARVAIIAENGRDATRLRAALAVALKVPIGRIGSGFRQNPQRITIMTWKYLAAKWPGEIDVVLISEAKQVLGKIVESTRPNGRLVPIRGYGFVGAGHDRIGDAVYEKYDELELLSKLGPTISGREPSASEKFVYFVDIDAKELRASEILARKRERWRDPGRNEGIAHAARGLARTPLASLLLTDFGETRTSGEDLPTVTVLTENLEHAQALERYLPWPINPKSSKNDLSLAPRQAIRTLLDAHDRGVSPGVLIVSPGVDLPPDLEYLPARNAGSKGVVIVWITDDRHLSTSHKAPPPNFTTKKGWVYGGSLRKGDRYLPTITMTQQPQTKRLRPSPLLTAWPVNTSTRLESGVLPAAGV